MRRGDLASTQTYTGRGTDASGYVYVLSTGHRSEAGLPIVKIGMTSRTPDKRVKELSRGGPIGMTLEGFVTSRDPRALERSAHQKFAGFKYVAGGGTEYFAAEPAEVLAWLRTTSSRFELESAKRSAWKEYTESIPFKQRARIMMFPLYLSGICFWVDLLFWHPNLLIVFLGLPVGFIGGHLMVWLFLRSLLKRIGARCAAIRARLEEKYHLPDGGVSVPL
jgi:hypothetical protein